MQSELFEKSHQCEIFTRYEKARILGIRANELAHNEPAKIRVEDYRKDGKPLTDAKDIAEIEWAEGKLAYLIKRYYPNGESLTIDTKDAIKREEVDKIIP